MTSDFTWSKLFCCTSVQFQLASLLSRSVTGFSTSDRFGRYWPRYWTIPRKLRSPLTSVGGLISVMALTFSSSGDTPSLVMTWPRNFTLHFLISHFSLFSFRPAFLSLLSTSLKRSSCSLIDFPHTITSSWYDVTPSIPSRMFVISRWNISEALQIPNGSRRKQYLPWGVMNVVSLALCVSSGSCQYPLAASSFENMTEPDNFGNISSIVGNMYLSRFMFLFRSFRSTHMRILPFFFITITIGAHQSVGSVIFSITPSASIRFNSVSTLCNNGIGTRRATLIWYGVAFSFKVIFTGLQLTIPSSWMLSWIKPISDDACLLRRLLPGPSTTYTQNCTSVPALNIPSDLGMLPYDFKVVSGGMSFGGCLRRRYCISDMTDTSAPESILNSIDSPLMMTLVVHGSSRSLDLSLIMPRKYGSLLSGWLSAV